MAYIGNEPVIGQWRKLTDISSGFNGVTTTFTLSVPPGTSQYYVTPGSASQLLISLGGIIQEPDVDYTVSLSTITFTTPPTLGLNFFGILCGDALNAGVPSDGTIIDAKVASNAAINSTKLKFNQSGAGAVERTVDNKLKDIVSVKDFGAVGDGVADDTAAIQAALSYANTVKQTLVFHPGTYKIAGGSTLDIQTSVDFGGCTIDASTWSGGLRINRSKVKQTYTTGSSVVTALNTTAPGYLVEGSSCFDGWLNTQEVIDSFVRITYDTDFYSYRGDIQKRQEYNKVYRYGVLSSPLKYALTGATATQVEVWPVEDRFIEVSGLTLDYGGAAAPASNPIRIERSLVRLSKIRFKLPTGVNSTNNPTLVSVKESCHVLLDDIYTPFNLVSNLGPGSSFAYALGIDDSYDVRVKNFKSDGNGWGATGSNSCQRVEFEGCDLSRIDFHKPVREYLKITRCNLGDWGVSVCILGDLTITDSSFTDRLMATYGTSVSFIRSREDTGGFCDGDLLIYGCVFNTVNTGNSLLLTATPTTGNPKPAASPINYTFFKSIAVENCRFPNVAAGYFLNPVITQTNVANEELKYPLSYSVDNCCGNLQYSPNLDGQHPAFVRTPAEFPLLANNFNHVFTATNSTFYRVHILEEGSGDFYISATLSNIKPSYAGSDGLKYVWIRMTANGFYEVSNSVLTKVDLSHTTPGTATINPCVVLVKNSTIIDNSSIDSGSQLLKKDASAVVDVTLKGCYIHTADNNRLLCAFNALVSNCKFYLNGTLQQPILTNDLAGAATGTLTMLTPVAGYTIVPKTLQKYSLLSAFSGSNTITLNTFSVPAFTNYHATTAANNASSVMQLVDIKRTGTATFDLTSSTAGLRYFVYNGD